MRIVFKDLASRDVFRRKNDTVFQFFEDGILKELGLSSGNVKEEVSLVFLDSVGKVVSFSNGEYLSERGVFSDPVSNEPRFSTPTDGIDNEDDFTVSGVSIKSLFKFGLPGPRITGDQFGGREDKVDPFHASSVSNKNGGVLLRDKLSGGLSRLFNDPLLELGEIVSFPLFTR